MLGRQRKTTTQHPRGNKKGGTHMKPCSSLIAVLPLLCAMASCTEVDLCQAEHPHRSFMDFRFHWKEDTKETVPTAWE